MTTPSLPAGERPNAYGFFKDVAAKCFDGGSDLDYMDFLSLGVKHGLLETVPYDPAVHGPNDWGAELGDDWYAMVALRPHPVPSQVEALVNAAGAVVATLGAGDWLDRALPKVRVRELAVALAQYRAAIAKAEAPRAEAQTEREELVNWLLDRLDEDDTESDVGQNFKRIATLLRTAVPRVSEDLSGLSVTQDDFDRWVLCGESDAIARFVSRLQEWGRE